MCNVIYMYMRNTIQLAQVSINIHRLGGPTTFLVTLLYQLSYQGSSAGWDESLIQIRVHAVLLIGYSWCRSRTK